MRRAARAVDCAGCGECDFRSDWEAIASAAFSDRGACQGLASSCFERFYMPNTAY